VSHCVGRPFQVVFDGPEEPSYIHLATPDAKSYRASGNCIAGFLDRRAAVQRIQAAKRATACQNMAFSHAIARVVRQGTQFPESVRLSLTRMTALLARCTKPSLAITRVSARLPDCIRAAESCCGELEQVCGPRRHKPMAPLVDERGRLPRTATNTADGTSKGRC